MAVFFLLVAVLFSAPGVLASPSYEEELVSRAESLNLSNEVQWRRLLLISPAPNNPNRSLVEDPKFFFSLHGASDPRLELGATLAAFFRPNDDVDLKADPPINNHPQCRFPARYRWLKRKLNFDSTRLPEINCERVETLIGDVAADRVSLVFASSYISNPSSMFGHTFLRLHKARSGKTETSALLDHAAGFAANPDTSSVLAFAWKGLAGGFTGTFNLTPYYMKIQEYNNSESRDLWEYELNLLPEQTDFLMRVLAEWGPFAIPYFYFSTNCGSMLLSLIDVSAPEQNLMAQFSVWLTPGDVIRAVMEAPGLVRNVRYLPSALSRYRSRYSLLRDPSEREAFEGLLENTAVWLPKIKLSDAAIRARVLDTAVEYIDFKEKLAANLLPERYADLRRNVLMMRSTTRPRPEPLPPPPESWNPGAAHGSVRISPALTYSAQTGSIFGFNWRPALHDVGASSMGYSSDLEIRFLDLYARFAPAQRDFWLSRFGLLDILCLSPRQPMVSPTSFQFALAVDEESTPTSAALRSFRKYIRLGVGSTWKPNPFSPSVYALGLLDLGSSDISGQGFHVGAGIRTGILWSPIDKLTFSVLGIGLRRFGQVDMWAWKAAVNLNYSLSQDSEVRLEGTWVPNDVLFEISYAHYLWHAA